MLVMIISACSGNALKRTRKIVDLYLDCLGERTWRGHLTDEALTSLRAELNSVASKNTAVAAHIVRTRQEFDLLWIIGSKAKFSPQGEFALHVDNDIKENLQVTAPRRFDGNAHLSAVIELAGLWHDVGKANLCFQEKLKNDQAKADPIRHEILSALVFVRFCKILPTIDLTDEVAFEHHLLAAAGAPFTLKGGEEAIDLTPADLPYPLQLCAWLIATHHRLPMAAESIQDRPIFDLRLHSDPEALKGIGSITIDCRVFTKKLVDQCSKLFKDLAARNDEALPSWPIASLYGRLALILADRNISRIQTIDQTWRLEAGYSDEAKLPADALLANTIISEDRDKLAARPKQLLDEHLIKVSAQCPLTISDLLDWQGLGPAIEECSMPPDTKKPATGRFAWQNTATDAVRNHVKSGRGFFGCVIAATGSGKTRAIPKIMAARGQPLRYSLALALRSLTLQSGTNYSHDLGFSPDETATLIGDATAQEIYERAAAKTGSQSSSDLLRRQDFLIEEDRNASQREKRKVLRKLPAQIVRHLSKDDKDIASRFLSAPISISTIDQLMPSADARRTSYLVSALRLMSSDLVIDEVDNFEDEDLVAIGRLVYVAGLYGRSVLISSATLPGSIATAYYNAYRAGLTAHAAAKKEAATIDVFLFSDAAISDSSRYCDNPEQDTFSAQYQAFTKDISATLDNEPVIRKCEIIANVLPGSDRPLEILHGTVVDKLVGLHQSHGTRDKRTGQILSLLSVRLNHVQSVANFAKWLAENASDKIPQDISLKIIPYHAAFPLLQRSMIESQLDQLLTQRQQDIFRRDLPRRLMREANDKAVMVVVVSTSLIETGRDYDFDGGIAEITSMRSLIQYAGRIDRHRRRKTTTPNLFILPKPISAITGDRTGLHYSKPGPEVARPPVGLHPFELPSTLAAFNLDAAQLEHLTAKGRLIDIGLAPLPDLERRKSEAYLHGADYVTLNSFHASPTMPFLAATHASKMRFRRSEPQLDIWLDPVQNIFKGRETNTRIVNISHSRSEDELMAKFVPFSLDPEMLLRTRLEEESRGSGHILAAHIIDNAKRFMRSSISQSQTNMVTYSWYLGLHRTVDSDTNNFDVIG